MPSYCLGAAGFPLVSEEEADAYRPAGDYKLEGRPRAPTSLTSWFRNAVRQAWAMACFYGEEWYSQWEAAAT